MAIETEIVLFGIALFFLCIIVFFALLRLSNKMIAKKLALLAEKQDDSEKMLKKFAEMTVENKKEIEGLKKGLERDERKISGIRKEVETELAAPSSEKAVEKAVVHVPKNR